MILFSGVSAIEDLTALTVEDFSALETLPINIWFLCGMWYLHTNLKLRKQCKLGQELNILQYNKGPVLFIFFQNACI